MYENMASYLGFTGTEFRYPLLFAIKGIKSPEQVREDTAEEQWGRRHIDYLWLAEAEESLQPDKDSFFITDDAFRSLCVGLNEGTNGWALLTGLTNGTRIQELIEGLSARKLKPFAAGASAEALRRAAAEFTDLGPRPSGVIYFGQLLVRYALIYGRDLGGDPHEASHTIEEYAPGVVLVLGRLDEQEKVLVQGLTGMGAPVVSLDPDHGLVGHVYHVDTVPGMMEKVWLLPNIRARLVKRATPDLPVPSGPVFRRETLKDQDVRRRAQSSKNGFMVSMPSDAESDAIKVFGSLEGASGFSVLIELGNSEADPPVTLWVDAILQSVCKYAKGVKIVTRGRSDVTLQMTGAAVDAGFNLMHLGSLIIAELRNEFTAIGPVRVTFILDETEEERLRPMVNDYLEERRRLVEEATEDDLKVFYGCTRCRSFSLGHACTVTPERPAQCSKPWYMLKAYAVLAPSSVFNPCQLVEKGECLDPTRGEYSGVNQSTFERTGGRVCRVFLHSIFGHPHTACSCFQNVAYYIPEVDGIAIMDRGYKGVAPGNMTWTRLANMVAGKQYGGGAATIATQYLKSPKFLQADGGYRRVVWMTETLKLFAKDVIPEEHRERIATELSAITLEELKKVCDRDVG